MPIYIKDPEASALAEKLAKTGGTSKTELVRRLLREEADRVERMSTVEERFRAIMEISRKGGEIARKYKIPPYTKEEADKMFDYLYEDEAPVAAKIKARRRA